MPTKRKDRSSLSAPASIACLFAALCCAGAYVSIPIPIGPVPLALTNFFAVLGGMLLGPVWGGLSTMLYLLVGALGFPVFSGGRGGLAHFAGPTGGYLLGYFVGAVLSGLIAHSRRKLFSAFGAIVGFASILLTGVVGLKFLSGMLWTKALAVGILPFLPGDAIKAAIAAVIAIRLGPFVDSLITPRVNHA